MKHVEWVFAFPDSLQQQVRLQGALSMEEGLVPEERACAILIPSLWRRKSCKTSSWGMFLPGTWVPQLCHAWCNLPALTFHWPFPALGGGLEGVMLCGTPQPGSAGLFESPAKISPPSCVLGCRR